MSLRRPLIPVLCLFALSLWAQNRLKPYEEYIARYADIAVGQQKKHGVPASITLAQGILESGAGLSDMARRSNNHFGIKCHSSWTGDTVVYFDDGVNSCFRKYGRVEQSYDDHSMFLVNGRRYAPLFLIDVTDYKGWAYGLKNAGYATDPSYADKLIRIIETYGLNDFVTGERKALRSVEDSLRADKATDRKKTETRLKSDRQARKDSIQSVRAMDKARKAEEVKARKAVEAVNDSILKSVRKAERAVRKRVRDSIASTYSIFTNKALENVKDYQSIQKPKAAQTIHPLSGHAVLYLGSLPYVRAQYGDSFESIADEFGLSAGRIRSINEFPRNVRLQTGEPVYLDTKSSWWEGEHPLHIAKPGESMHAIAQKYGLRLDALYKLNDMAPGSPIKPGTKVKLRNPDQLSPFMRALNQAFNKTDSTTVQPKVSTDSLPAPAVQGTPAPERKQAPATDNTPHIIIR